MNREGMILVLFDLPVRTKQQQAEYRRFTKHLKKNRLYVLPEIGLCETAS